MSPGCYLRFMAAEASAQLPRTTVVLGRLPTCQPLSTCRAGSWGLIARSSPKVLSSLTAKELTALLQACAERSRSGALESPLVAGTARALLEATAAHALVQRRGSYTETVNFPGLLGQAFTALGLATPSDPVVAGELVQRRVERTASSSTCVLALIRVI